jgi:hypothetical protein
VDLEHIPLGRAGSVDATIHALLAEYGRAVALRVAVELGCGLADRARIERCADEVLQELVAKQAKKGAATRWNGRSRSDGRP